MSGQYEREQPLRRDIDESRGPLVLEFGTDWCGYCQAAQPLIGSALQTHPEVRHLKIEDGKGRALGRSFGVKLWPSLIFLHDGVERARVVRPESAEPVLQGLDAIAHA